MRKSQFSEPQIVQILRRAEVRASLGARRVIAVLERVFAEQGQQEWLGSDNGPEFIAQVLKRWLAERGPKPR
jgi:hypothetical protein